MANPKPTLTPPHSIWDSDSWELVNDDGFVYKRKKRRVDPTATTAPASDPIPDPGLALKRKRKTLVQIKNKYKSEIVLWEHLSNTLKAMENRVRIKDASILNQNQRNGVVDSVLPQINRPSLLSQILFQVEAQEATIRDFSQLCDVAESLCRAHEEKANQQFFDLPVWRSPRELVSSLSEDS